MRASQSFFFSVFLSFFGFTGAEAGQSATARGCGIAVNADNGAVVAISLPEGSFKACREAGDTGLSAKREIAVRDELIERLKKENSELRNNQLNAILKKSGEALRGSFPDEIKEAYKKGDTQAVASYLSQQENRAAVLASDAKTSAAQYALEIAYVLRNSNQRLALEALRRAIELDPGNVDALLAIGLELVSSSDSTEVEKYLPLLRREFLSEKYKVSNRSADRINFLIYSLIEIINSFSRGNFHVAYESARNAIAYSEALSFSGKSGQELASIARFFRFYATVFEVIERSRKGGKAIAELSTGLVNFVNKEFAGNQEDEGAYYLLVSVYSLHIDESIERGRINEANKFYEAISESVRSRYERAPEDRFLTFLYSEVLRVGAKLKRIGQPDVARELMLKRVSLVKNIYSKDVENVSVSVKLAGVYLDLLEDQWSLYSEAEIDSYRRNLLVILRSIDSRLGLNRSADLDKLFGRFSSQLLNMGRYKEVVDLVSERTGASGPMDERRLDIDIRASAMAHITLGRAYAGLEQWDAAINAMSNARAEMNSRLADDYNDIDADWAFYYENYYWISVHKGGCKSAARTLKQFFDYYDRRAESLSRNSYVQARMADFYKRLGRCESNFEERRVFDLVRVKHSAAALKLDEMNFDYFKSHLDSLMDLVLGSLLVSRPADARSYAEKFQQLTVKCAPIFGKGPQCMEYEALGLFVLAVMGGSDSPEFLGLLRRSIELYRSIIGASSEIKVKLNFVNVLSLYAASYPVEIGYDEAVAVLREAHRIASDIPASQLNDQQVKWVIDLGKWLDSGVRTQFSQENWYIYGMSK